MRAEGLRPRRLSPALTLALVGVLTDTMSYPADQPRYEMTTQECFLRTSDVQSNELLRCSGTFDSNLHDWIACR